MRRFLSYILPALAALLCLGACHRHGRIISRGDMTRIYAEMFLLDEQMWSDYQLRRIADTTLIYEHVFRKYGYTTEDYLASREYYLKDAGRYTRMLKKSVAILEDENKALKKEKSRIDAVTLAASNLRRFAPNRIYLLDTLPIGMDSLRVDSLFNFDFQKGMDTAYYGPRMVVWADTLIKETVDSTAAKKTEVKAEVVRKEEGKKGLSEGSKQIKPRERKTHVAL